jgi:histidinol phosphatase-like enzyme
MSQRICLDFDGVLHNPSDRVQGYKMGQPVAGALDAVRALVAAGHSIVIHTARVQQDGDTEHVWKWLRYFGFERYIDAIQRTKPLADVYVDDKGLHFDNWISALPHLL